jgi:hypothetical protein
MLRLLTIGGAIYAGSLIAMAAIAQ